MKGTKRFLAFITAVVMLTSLMSAGVMVVGAASAEPLRVYSTNVDTVTSITTVSNQAGSSSKLPKFIPSNGNKNIVFDTLGYENVAYESGDSAILRIGEKSGTAFVANTFTDANMENEVMYRSWTVKYETNFALTNFGLRWGKADYNGDIKAQDNNLFLIDATGKLSFSGYNDTIVYDTLLTLGDTYTIETVIDMRSGKCIAEYYITKNDGEREYAGTVQTKGHMTDNKLTTGCGRTSFESFVRVYAYKSDKTKTQNLKLTVSDVEGYLGSLVPISAKAPIKVFASDDGIAGNYSSSWQTTTTSLPKYTQNSGNNTFCLDTTAYLDAEYVSGNKVRLYYGDNLTSTLLTTDNMNDLVMHRKWTFKFEENLVSTDFGIRWGATNFTNSETGTVDRVLFNVGANGVLTFKDKNNAVAVTYADAITVGNEYTVEAFIDMRTDNAIADFYVTKNDEVRKYAGWVFTTGSNATNEQYKKLSFSSFVHSYAYKPGELTKTQATKITISDLEAYLVRPDSLYEKGAVKVFSSDDDMKDFASSNLKGNSSTIPKFAKDAANKEATLTTQLGTEYVPGDVARLFYGATPATYFTLENMEKDVMYRSWTFKFDDVFVRTRFGARYGNTAWVSGETVDVELFEVGYDGILKFNGENNTGFSYDNVLELGKEYTVEAVIDMRGDTRKAEFYLTEEGKKASKLGETTTTGGGLEATEKKSFASFVFTEPFVPDSPSVTQGTKITVSNIKAYLGAPEINLEDYNIGKIKTAMDSVATDNVYRDGTLEVKSFVQNNMSDSLDITIIAALYSGDNTLLNVAMDDYSIKSGDGVEVSTSLEIKNAKNTSVKVMLVDTINTLMPYVKAHKVTRDPACDLATLYLVGDSLCQEYGEEDYPMQGWGYYLPDYLTSDIKVDNRAKSGWSTKTFIESTDETYSWNAIKTSLKAGDMVLVALGINDASINGANKTTEEEYITNLETMIAETKAAGAEIIFATPTISGGTEGSENGWEYSLSNAWAARGDVCRETAEANDCVCIPLGSTLADLYETMYETYLSENPDATISEARDYVRYYFHLYVSEIMKPIDEGGWGIIYISKLPHKYYKWNAETGYTYINDTTHVNERGAQKIAEVIATLISQSDSALADFVE